MINCNSLLLMLTTLLFFCWMCFWYSSIGYQTFSSCSFIPSRQFDEMTISLQFLKLPWQPRHDMQIFRYNYSISNTAMLVHFDISLLFSNNFVSSSSSSSSSPSRLPPCHHPSSSSSVAVKDNKYLTECIVFLRSVKYSDTQLSNYRPVRTVI